MEITVQELKHQIDSGDDPFLLDVREEFERDIVNIGGMLIPMNQI